MKKQVAIVGTGPCGIMTLQGLKPLWEKGEVDMVAYEKQETFGGLWNYSDETGQDRWDERCPGSMYRKLWINGPREAIEVPDLLFPEDMPTYTPREVITDWWGQYVRKFELDKFMEFSTRVENVSFDGESKKFSLTVRKFGEEPTTKEFDYVVVASGHFSFPNDPDFEGLETFKGHVMHSHDFRDGTKFKGKRVLCIGGSYSSEDIAMQCWRMGAKKTTVTCRRKIGYQWPKGMEEKAILTHIKGSTVYFSDKSKGDYDVIIKCTYLYRNGGEGHPDQGMEEKAILTHIKGSTVYFSDKSKGDYDVIIKCTGYLHKFPFLPDELAVKTKNILTPPLYKLTVFPDNHQLLYMGMYDQYFTFQMFWVQGRFVAKIISGEIQLPSKAEMLEDIKHEQELEEPKDSAHDIDLQSRHVNYFTEVTGSPNVDHGYILQQWLREKKENILTFRDKCHTCHFTGTKAPEPEPKWLDHLLM